MAGGIGASGFTLPTLEEIEAELRTALLANISASQDLSPEGPMGQIVTIFARQIVSAWEALATAYGAVDPNAAEGVLLDNICALIGAVREAATRSTVTCTLNQGTSVTVPQGSQIAVNGQPNIQFELTKDVTSTSSGNYPGVFQAVNTGPVAANAGTLTVIVTPVSGWNSVTNALSAELGRNVETDAELRVRRRELVTRPGAANADAIRADVLSVDGVEQCFVFENVTPSYNADGMPPHSFEVVIWDGLSPAADNNEVADAIWDSKPAGIKAHGVTVISHTSDSGDVVPIGFTRAAPRNIYIDLTVVTNSDFDAVNGPAAIKTLVTTKGNALKAGEDVIALVLRAAAQSQKGVTDVTVFELDFSAAPSNTANLVIGSREIARFDVARITVTVA